MTRHNAKGLLRDRRGAVAAWVALMLVMLLGMGALAVDMSFLWVMRNRLQSTADAAALAGASQLGVDEATVKAQAVAYAQKNLPPGSHGTALADADVVLGHWDNDTRTFIPVGTTAAPGTACSNPVPQETNPNCLPLDAVKVTTRRAQANGNPVSLFFAGVLGIQTADVVTAAIAEGEGGPGGEDNCYTNGIVAGRQVLAGSTLQLFDAFCVHGEEMGVKVGSQNTFQNGTEISMPDLALLDAGSDNIGLEDALYERSMLPDVAYQVGELIDGIKNDLPDYMPDYINTVSYSLPSNALDGYGTPWGVEGTAYIINETVSIDSGRTLNNVVIIAENVLSIGSDFTITNAILAANNTGGTVGRVQLGSYGTIGSSEYCLSGLGTVEVLAMENVLVGSNTDIFGGQFIAGVDADLGSDLISTTGLGIQAVRDVKLGSQLEFTGCLADLDNRYTTTGVAAVLRLVD